MYNRFLIQNGGGIIPQSGNVELKNSVNIAIGLGGTGIDCLRTLKKEVFAGVKPDSENELSAKYNHIKFLAVDADRASIGNADNVDSIDSATEFFDISCYDILSLLNNAHFFANNPSLAWLKTANTQDGTGGINIISATAGAGGIRQVGRLLLFRRVTDFVQKLTNIISEARQGIIYNTEINIHIFTGISGGTGGGIFLDVCYIIQHVLETMGLGSQAYTYGYFFMPDVNLSNTPQKYIPLNGFAAMKELDYAMNFANNGDKWDQDYGGFRITTNEPPVQLAHLVSVTNADGIPDTDEYTNAISATAEYVLTTIINRLFSAIKDKNHIIKKHGACYNYCVIGAAKAYIPRKEITTYLTSKIFEGFKNLDKQLTTDYDIDKFTASCGLRYDDFQKAVMSETYPIVLRPFDAKILYEQVQVINHTAIPDSLKYLSYDLIRNSDKLVKNKKLLLNKYPSDLAETPTRIYSVYTRVKTALMKIAADPDKGPYYAESILHNTNSKDLINIIEGYIIQNDKNIHQCHLNIELCDKAQRGTLIDFQHCNFLSRKRKANEYVNAVHAYFREKMMLEQFVVLGEIFIKIKTQLMELYETFFRTFGDVMRELQQTFDANLETLCQPNSDNNGYAVQLVTVNDMSHTLDQAVNQMHMPDIIHGFITKLLSNPEVWVDHNQNKISAAVSEYFLSILNDFTNKSINDYLKLKFNTDNSAILQAEILSEIIMPLGRRSVPLFRFDRSVNYSPENYTSREFLFIPDFSPEIENASNLYKNNNAGVDVHKSYAQDSISILRISFGIPMFAYKGVSEYKCNYINGLYSNTGSHIYEGSIADPRDSRALIDITPISAIPESLLTEKEKSDIEIYEKALESGIISKASGSSYYTEYNINIYDKAMLDYFKIQAEEIVRQANIDKVTEFHNTMKENGLAVLETIRLPSVEKNDYEKVIIQDFVIGSMVYMNAIKEQLEIITEWNDIIRTLAEAEKKHKYIESFAQAVAAGVIIQKNDYHYSYIKKHNNTEETIDFTTIESMPYGMQIPLYSAFCGYIQISDELKAEIASETKSRFTNNKEIVSASINMAKRFAEPVYLNEIFSICMHEFTEESSFIKTFYDQFNQQVKFSEEIYLQ